MVSDNLGQNKMEQLTPFPQSNNEGAKDQKRAILVSLKCGRADPKIQFILKILVFRHFNFKRKRKQTEQ